MTLQALNERYRAINRLVASRRLKKALEDLADLITITREGTFRASLDNLSTTYENMLRYTLEGVEDPEREKIYDHLRRSIVELNTRLRGKVMEEDPLLQTSVLKRDMAVRQQLSGKEFISTLDDLYFRSDLEQLMKKHYGVSTPPLSETRARHETIRNIFNFFWLSDTYNDAASDLAALTLDHARFAWHERALFVTAITLSLLRYFDPQKFVLLHRYWLDNETEVKERSLTGLILAFYIYDDIIPLFPETDGILQGLSEQKGILSDLEAITLQIIRSKETEQISRKLKEEIIPEITKMGPDLREKLKLDDLIPKDFLEDKNPDWSKVFKSSESLYEKMEEFSRMQMEGADVFMSAFAHLKNFPFFEEFMNWFVPFYPDHPVIEEVLGNMEEGTDKGTLLEGLYRTPFICNSDKYSFCLNLRIMPSAQRTLLVQLFNAELEGLRETDEEEKLLHPGNRSRVIYTQYIQDLYRFFKLHPMRKEFEDLFSMPLDLYHSAFFARLAPGKELRERIAAWFFEHDRYEEALDLFQKLHSEGVRPSYELLEKMGYAAQKLKRFEEALQWYKQAEILESDRTWLIKKIAWCYRALKRPEEALEYYRKAEKDEPDNMYIQASIGHCYLDMEQYEEALKYYFKVAYHQPDNIRIWRPIAWCYFVTGKLEEAGKYYDKILEKEPLHHDFLNAGHVAWALGNRREAIRLYQQAYKKGGGDFRKFLKIFEADRPWLLRNGIDPQEIPLLLDYLDYTLPQ